MNDQFFKNIELILSAVKIQQTQYVKSLQKKKKTLRKIDQQFSETRVFY